MTIERCYGIAVAELGLSPAEFWMMTPRQFAAAHAVLRERREEESALEKRADHRAAYIACKVHNMLKSAESPALHPWDIYPWLAPETQTDEEIYQAFRAFSEQHNARFLEA